jgi:hypothetical protein
MVNGLAMSVYKSGVSGALPATFTPDAFDTVNYGAGAWFYRSA